MAALTAVWHEVFFARGPITSGNLSFPFRMDAMYAKYASFWNPVLQFPNVETIDRLAWMAPFLVLQDPVQVERAMIAAATLGSGVLMYAAARRLGASVPVACLAGIVYGCNPWIANRVQHLFLLPGYAVLPAVVALWVRPLERHGALVLVALLTLGSATPHTTAALWAVSAIVVLVRPSRASVTRFGLTAAAYVAVNLYWLLPVAAFMTTVDLVPSWPTWDHVRLLSRHAGVADVVRLEGYWWPLADVRLAAWSLPFGASLVAASAIGLWRVSRERILFAFLALSCFGLALGTGIEWWVELAVIEGPLADRTGWLLRDPNKAVGPLAAFLLLTAVAEGGRGDGDRWTRGIDRRGIAVAALLGAYLVFAVPYVRDYVHEAYESHPIPTAFHAASAWLEGREGRVAWTPAYFGTRTYWNGDLVTPDVLSSSSPIPVLAPYAYDESARRAYMTLDFGAILQDVPADLPHLMRRWGVRWLGNHRDVLPLRLQPAGAFDHRVEFRPFLLRASDLSPVYDVGEVTLYDAGPLPDEGPAVPVLAQRPTAAAATLSLFGDSAFAVAAVEDARPEVGTVLHMPGDEPRLQLADDQVRIDLAGAAPHAAPHERWSRYGETDTAWWPRLRTRGGAPPVDAGAVVTTSRRGAELRTNVDTLAGRYRVWIRAYRGPESGAVRFSFDRERTAETVHSVVLELSDRSPSMTWTSAGTVEVRGSLTLSVENLDGTNVVADVRLVPEDAWAVASERARQLDHVRVWTPTPGCRASTPGTTLVRASPSDGTVPWDGSLASDAHWSDVAAVEVDLRGHGTDHVLAIWTRSDDVWVLLGEVRVWWRGSRSVIVPVRASSFASAPRGADVPADLLRIRPSRAQPFLDTEVTSEEPLASRVEEVRLSESAPCAWTFRSEHDRTWTWVWATDGPNQAVDVVVDGVELRLDPARSTSLHVPAGVHHIQFPHGVPSGVRALWLGPTSPAGLVADLRRDFGSGGPGMAEGEACAEEWRLWRSRDRFVEGLYGVVGQDRVEAVRVDGFVAGYWIPPGICGAPRPVNPWKRVGLASLIVSLGAAFALVPLSVSGRLP